MLFLVVCRANATIDVSLQMQLGNPSNASADTNNHAHYLIQRPVEAIDYSDNLGEPVWASWDLTAGDVGSASRSTTYFTDTNLPPNFYRVTTADYNGVGNIDFNRGHLCPSAHGNFAVAGSSFPFLQSNNTQAEIVFATETIDFFLRGVLCETPCLQETDKKKSSGLP